MTTQPTSTYWVSIGRNIGETPMWRRDWHAYCRSIRNLGDVIAEVNGQSEWEGIAEETYLVLLSIPTDSVPTVRAQLTTLATLHKQDGIGFVGGPGTDTYIGADK